MIKIICIGKKHERIYLPAIEHFESRLSHYDRVEWHIIPQSGHEGIQARDEESKHILAKLGRDDTVILLDEKGPALTSPDIAQKIEDAKNSSRTICVVIGGAYGVNDELFNKADVRLSFGKVVFPHQLVRLMALEQLYRAHCILAGTQYHHL